MNFAQIYKKLPWMKTATFSEYIKHLHDWSKGELKQLDQLGQEDLILIFKKKLTEFLNETKTKEKSEKKVLSKEAKLKRAQEDKNGPVAWIELKKQVELNKINKVKNLPTPTNNEKLDVWTKKLNKDILKELKIKNKTKP